jgi:hypothetical protein
MDRVETDERDTLSECHREFMARYVEFELLRQERASESFLKRRASALVPSSVKASHNQS